MAPSREAASQLSAFTIDDEWPSIALIRPQSSSHPPGTTFLCMLCEEKSKGLFPYAMELSSRVILSEQVQELEEEEDLRAEVSALVGAAQWGFTTFATATGVGGRDHGIRAIGVGSNSKSRRRAARIALAVTVRLRSPTVSCESPDGTGAFASLLARARRLFVGQGKDPLSRASGSGSELLPGPPPDLEAMHRDRGVSASSAEAMERPPPQPEAAGALDGRTVVAVAVYEAEFGGYLPLKPGDRVYLRCDTCYPPDGNCKFLQYVYGVRTKGPSDDTGAPADGWFPFDLVTFA